MRVRPGLAPGFFALLILPCLFHPAPAAASLIGYWNFNGCTATDASGHGQTLTPLGGPVCEAAHLGEGWKLDGVSACFFGSGTTLDSPGASPWTVCAWVKTTRGAGSRFAVVAEWYRCGANPGCTTGDAACYILGVSGDHPNWDVRDNDGHDHTIDAPAHPIADGAWHFLVGTMNPPVGRVRLYVDGALVDSADGTLTSFDDGGLGVPVQLGRHYRTGWGSPDYYFDGSIDEVRIYNEELSPGAVSQLYASSAAGVGGADVAGGISLAGPASNPSRGGRMPVRFSLASSAPARLAIYDVVGRLVAVRDVGSLGAGAHQLDLSDGRRLAPGTYLIELRQGGSTVKRKATVVG